jgi:hypothetical protein
MDPEAYRKVGQARVSGLANIHLFITWMVRQRVII